MMPRCERNNFNCICCSKRVRPRDRKKVNKDISRYLQKKFLISALDNSIICNRCRHRYRKDRKERSDHQQSITTRLPESDDEYQIQASVRPTPKSPPSVSLPIASTVKSHAYCFICKKPGPKLVQVSSACRLSVFVQHNILIAEGNRCCPNHLRDGVLTPDSLQNLKTTDHVFLNKHSVLDLLSKMRHLCQVNKNYRLDFDNKESLTNEDYTSLTGLTKENFQDLYQIVHHHIKNTPSRSVRTTLAIFLCKLNSGLSNRFLATLFNVTKSSLRRAIKTVRQVLMNNLVPQNLGFHHVSREKVIKDHTRPLAASLFGTTGEEAILVLDGTYIYIDKSSNFHFQRRSYSVHKGRPLLKPMVIVTTSGYFVSVLGPYLSDFKNNDASILTHIIKTNVEDIKKWVKDEDIFVVDRGFRDAIPLLEDLGIQAEMPKFMSKGQKQLTTEDANMSRLVTKVRWVVESSNARIKRWKYLSHTLPTNQIPFIGDYVKIVCALNNKYFPELSTCVSQEEDEAQAAKMLYLAKQGNTLQEYVEKNNLGRKSAIWKNASEINLKNFPTLDDEQLRNITVGTYQLKLSASYIQEHLENDSFIQFHEDDSHLLRVRIQSRHISSKKYTLWIKYNEACVESWYCLCPCGARVVGMCSHVSAIIWYLGKARSMDGKSVGVRDWSTCVLDASDILPVVDQSDSESENELVEE
ncbi:uncharacterized protein LOC134280876 [Saccostrea cucullata]|uniref:uncharacterized protein LOC134280876 n=1 Tax=Saccostrea cuccullata TaxID=36930 RepID=UPI002ED0D0E2